MSQPPGPYSQQGPYLERPQMVPVGYVIPRAPLPTDPSWKAILWFSAGLVLVPVGLAFLVLLLVLGGAASILGAFEAQQAGDYMPFASAVIVGMLPSTVLPALIIIGNRALRAPWWAGTLVSAAVVVVVGLVLSRAFIHTGNGWLQGVSVVAGLFLVFGAFWMILALVLGPLLIAQSSRRRRARAFMAAGYPGPGYPGHPPPPPWKAGS
ncbi:hypothetical protein [Galactobacter caseinivorans]|uniref:Uncharacterized protein n=1 Tax=Galactobacter caseinivorans TaxID=2676123 RepID=A0A496PJ61_9MICC|nr:hypothetical protein [Galactobacter caseinivorans]RKW70507.1 hypothetical protein DWQ67_08530 [Galactobacter caseinivorans]